MHLQSIIAYISNNDATCTLDGTETSVCDNCDVTDTRVANGSALGHNYNEVWSNDEGQHWHECTICHEKKETADHSFAWIVDKEATETEAGSKHEECKVCGCKKAAVEIPATGTPTEPGKPTGPDSPQTGDNSNMILWIALLFISGGAVIGITAYSKKKKENAE